MQMSFLPQKITYLGLFNSFLDDSQTVTGFLTATRNAFASMWFSGPSVVGCREFSVSWWCVVPFRGREPSL